MFVVANPSDTAPSSKWVWVAVLNGGLVFNLPMLNEEGPHGSRVALTCNAFKKKKWMIHISGKFMDKCKNTHTIQFANAVLHIAR